MPYQLYLADNLTPVAIPQPVYASWETVPLGTFADGSPRVGRYKMVTWRFAPMTASEYQTLVQYRPPDGRMQFDTWKRPSGGVAGQFVTVRGIMPETIPAIERDGEYHGVSIPWTRVEEV